MGELLLSLPGMPGLDGRLQRRQIVRGLGHPAIAILHEVVATRHVRQ